MTGDWDVVVVGAGSAGCPFAARLADAGRRVLLLEAGPADAPDVRDASTLRAAAPGHPANRQVTAVLTPERTVRVPRGRVVGGSSAVNGGYFVRAPRADLDGWAAAGNELWSADAVLPAFRRLEADADFGDRPGHGADGPVPVRRPAPAPLADAFAAAADELGFPAEPDKNADGGPGYGPIPVNVADGVRVSAALAYLAPRRDLPGLTVRAGVAVRGVVVERGRAVGVRTDDGVVRAAEVVLSAGAVATPHLLLLSGIGPADDLRRAGLPVVADLPGVGTGSSDHPDVYLPWTPSRPVPAAAPLHGALNTGDVELQPWLASFAAAGLDPSAGELVVRVALQRPESRGRLRLDPRDPAADPVVEQRYLAAEADRRRLRDGVRLAAELLRTAALATLVAARGGPDDAALADDAALDRWIGASLGSAVHLCGTARMGPEGDPGAVVDQRLRVRGVEGLRVVDTSVLPWVPARGPAATAVAVGERAAELVTG
ncbi:mycofactocin system GMC family oxidoreductase MftG [Blastococcus sp. SYSU D00669]